MGHSTARAVLIHQHTSADRDRLIADALWEGAARRGHAELIGAPGNDEGPGRGNVL
ncbi:hypothetical protein [Streptomyces sp. NPDC057686]|uniref:hypothetical protein n=1 Tax=Streptomyces sp. NPDC057686 TaxID=3346212 RepID=UPI00367DB904